MKRTLVAAALLLACQQAAASGIYAGAKLGYLSPSVSRADTVSAGSITLGYELFDAVAMDVSVEGEYTKALKKGKIDLPAGKNLEYDYHNAGLFAAVRSAGPVYIRLRAGMVQQSVEINHTTTDKSGAAGGIGMGFSLVGLETSIDWTHYDNAGDFNSVDYLSVGVRF